MVIMRVDFFKKKPRDRELYKKKYQHEVTLN